MSNYKLIAFDMDGTLLNSKKEISAGNLEAIREAVSKGKYVALSTGRNMQELKKTLSETPEIGYVIGVSGALVIDIKEQYHIATTTIPFETVATILKRIRPYDCMVHIHSDISLVQEDKEAHMKDYNMGIYQGMFDELTVKAQNIEEFYLKEKIPVYKFNMYCRNPNQRLKLKGLLEDLPITMAFAEDASLECSALGTSKASGLLKLCDYLGISVNEAIAVGDADNDLEILKTAGLAVVMANGKKSALALADVVVKSNDEDGCAEAIYDYLLK